MRTRATWQMSARQLAKAFAEVAGYQGRKGGWIYDASGHPVAHGWDAFAVLLTRRGWITVGQGINWRRVGRLVGTA